MGWGKKEESRRDCKGRKKKERDLFARLGITSGRVVVGK